MNVRTAIYADPVSKDHDTGPGHPEHSARFDAALEGVRALPLAVSTRRAATEDEITLCHTLPYVRTVKREVQAGMTDLITGDTSICPRSFDVAVNAVGTALTAVDALMRGEYRNAFCIVRPPGHHATPDRGMGFCIFNNVAIAARYAQSHYGVERVLIADWDVHHGNGTQDIFYADPSVLFFSTHQHPWYPGTGAAGETGQGKGDGTTINCPLPAGSGREEILDAFRRRLEPAAEQYRPELVLVSAGFDSRAGDPLGRFLLHDDDFAELTLLMMEIAERFAGGRLLSLLEGGYSIAGLTAGVRAHAHALAGL